MSVHLCTRLAVVDHIVNQWEDLGSFTVDRNGDAYPTADAYRQEMLKPGTFGGTAEILAIPAVYGVNVQVWSLDGNRKKNLLAIPGRILESFQKEMTTIAITFISAPRLRTRGARPFMNWR